MLREFSKNPRGPCGLPPEATALPSAVALLDLKVDELLVLPLPPGPVMLQSCSFCTHLFLFLKTLCLVLFHCAHTVRTCSVF